jgi:predicted Zn finger-like uncharacterized protein
MKFQCERCKTRYSIADDKVRGKILKIRCKTCEATIVVREGQPARQALESVKVDAPAPTLAAPDPGPPAGSAAQSPPPAPPAQEWFLSTDGAQEGPLTAEEAQARVAGKADGAEMFAWRDDFAGWLPVEEVPVLAVHLPKPAPPPPRSGPPASVRSSSLSGLTPLPLAPDPPAPAAATPPLSADELFGRGDAGDSGDAFPAAVGTQPGADEPPAGLDFEISEASRVVKLSMLAPAARSQPAAPAALPGVAAPRPGGAEPEGANGPGDATPAPVAAPGRRRRVGFPLLAGGVAVVGVLAGAVLFNRDRSAPAAAEEPSVTISVDSESFYRTNPLVAPTAAAAPAADPTPTPAPAPAKAGTAGTKVASLAPRTRAGEGPLRLDPVTRTEPPRMVRPHDRGEKVDSFDPESVGPSDPLSPDDIRNAYAANEVGLKRCYERSLKADPTSSVSKMIVKITISPQGNVSAISVPDRASDLGSCVAASIRAWRFRRSSSEFTTEFTVFFAKRS